MLFFALPIPKIILFYSKELCPKLSPNIVNMIKMRPNTFYHYFYQIIFIIICNRVNYKLISSQALLETKLKFAVKPQKPVK